MSWTQMDMRLAEYTDELKAIGVPPEFLSALATSVRDEVVSISADIFRLRFSSHYPDAASVHNQIVYNWTFSEQQFNIIYGDDAVNQTAVLAANYLYFIYAQDTYFEAVKSIALKRGPSRPIAEFLTTGEVRSFRNAFAHGRWRYVGDDRYTSIEYLEGGRKDGITCLIHPRKLMLWHALSKTFLGLWSARMADLRQPVQKTSQVSK